MGKKLLLTIACLALIFQGCEAFKNYYDEAPPIEEEVAEESVEGAEAAEAKAKSTSEAVDYSVDTTPCTPVDGLISAVLEDMDAVDNSGWTVEGDSAVISEEKIGPFTTKVVISKGIKKLTMTIKQVAENSVYVCDAIYEDCEGECLGVKSMWSEIENGIIEVYELDKESGDIGSGSYNITFSESSMGDPGITLEGMYTVD